MPRRSAPRRWLAVLSVCLVVALAAFVAACGGGSDDSKTSTTTAGGGRGTAVADLGRRTFLANCASCHGMNGRTPTGTLGEYGPNFDDIKITSLDYVLYRIRYGGSGMQTFEDVLTPEERTAVADYVYRTAGSRVRDDLDVPRRDMALGKSVFDQYCQKCHGLAGRAMTGRPLFPGTDFGEVTPSYDHAMEKAINGYYWWMPSLRDKLDEARIKAVARYLEKVSGGHRFRPVLPFP